ncbi:MAG: hypothetical protein OXC65_10470 [Thiotrichales bacterium]|nr:hypothetical protein [Thiotrichales bacterium]MCY4285751.1 hypothetical protein [Thiotrichales bacterium]
MTMNVVVLMRSEKGRALVREKCKAAGLDIAVLERLIAAELDQIGKMKRRGLKDDFDEIFADLNEDED